ncbi:MAG: DUF4956 domain-containing protein [Lachnospiraceae bacterium]|nr:DUF4956 domain-containing protein [Lachnospiraceae bacterium]MDE7446756.1 DUF4956 domain-containing protein [Lachnospiraceae bacterium]
MNFSDVIKKSVLEGFSYADLSTAKIMTTLLITFLVAVYIFFVYKMITKSAFYFKSFNVSMAIISVVTAGIILAMQSSIVISLGMVGALSIVRFRTAIKDPMDLLFLFWSIGTGIICGAGLYKIAIILAVLVTAGLLILDMLPVRLSPYLLIINADTKEVEEQINDAVKKLAGAYKLKSKNITKDGMDLILEVRAGKEKELIDKISEMKGITAVSLLAHDGEVKG